MTDSSVGTLNRTVQNLDPSYTAKPAEGQAKTELGKDAFLTMLVAQLQNQDPLDPVSNEDWMAQMAQFSSLEQLIEINNKLDGSNDGEEFSSIASYLGHDIVTDMSTVRVRNGEGGKVHFKLPADSEDVRVDLLGSNGEIRGSLNLGALPAGAHTIELKDGSLPAGEFAVQVAASTLGGGAVNVDAFAAGVVNGYIPGAEPLLLMDGREVSPGRIREVRLSSSTS